MAGADVPAFPVESDPGDMVFFSEGLWHGSFGDRAGRRMFTLIYYENPKSEAQIAYLRDFHSRTLAMFHPHERFLNSDRPRVQGMVEKYVELGLVSAIEYGGGPVFPCRRERKRDGRCGNAPGSISRTPGGLRWLAGSGC